MTIGEIHHGRQGTKGGNEISETEAAFLTRKPKRADIAAGKESSDQVASRDWQVKVRRVRLVVVNGNPSGSRPSQVVTRESLQRAQGRLVVGAFDAKGDAFPSLEQACRRYNWNA
jgi:hypothetical protein